MPAIISFVTTFIVPTLSVLLSAIAPVAAIVMGFTLSRLTKIPRYVKLLRWLYEDSDPDSQARQYATLGLLLLSGILTFMAYSFVPGTMLPVVGSVMTAIAAMLAVVVSLTALDLIFTLNEGYWLDRLRQNNPEDVDDLLGDIAALSKLLGNSWNKLADKVRVLFDELLPKLAEEYDRNKDAFRDLDRYLSRQLQGLLSYLSDRQQQPPTGRKLERDKLKRLVTEGLTPQAKVGGSLAEGVTAGTIAGVGTSSVTSSLFVQAGFWTSMKTLVGLGSGLVVGASTYALLTVAAPLGFGTLASVGIYRGAMYLRTKGEQRKMSAFLADILMAALPMVWADGVLTPQEKDALHKLLDNPSLLESDRQRVYGAIERQSSFDEILQTELLRDRNPQKVRLKRRLLLCLAWELAKADGTIDAKEIELHDRMADLLGIDRDAVIEIRRIVTLESGIPLSERISVIRGDITQQSVEAIVNPTHRALNQPRSRWRAWLGSGKTVDRAVRRAAGSKLVKACERLDPCAIGEAKLTGGYNLPCQWVIHTVAPNSRRQEGAEELLAQCYRNSLALAQKHSIRSLAIPAIGTGGGKFPSDRAAQIAAREVAEFLSLNLSPERVTFVCDDDLICQQFSRAVAAELEQFDSSSNSVF